MLSVLSRKGFVVAEMRKLSSGGLVTLDDATSYLGKENKTLYRTKYGEWVLVTDLRDADKVDLVGQQADLVTHRTAVWWLWRNGHDDDAVANGIDEVDKDHKLKDFDR